MIVETPAQHWVQQAQQQAIYLADRLTEKGWCVAAAESCTGGWVAELLTSLNGASRWFDRGFVVYSNTAKQEMLGVPRDILAKHGAVSEPTAIAMAEGALRYSEAQCALAITGIAGPGGGTLDKPVGTVFISWAVLSQPPYAKKFHFEGDRTLVRAQALYHAIAGMALNFK